MPVLPGHAGGGALHPRPRPAAVRDAATATPTRRSRTAGARPRCGRARPVPGLQGLQDRLPGQRRHGHLQGRVPRPPLRRAGCGPARTTRWAGCRCSPRAGARRPGSPVVNALATRRCCRTSRDAGRRAREPRRSRCSPARRCSSGGRAAAARSPGSRGTVLLWPDTFTNHFHPHVGQAAVEVLEAAGWTVTHPDRAAVLRADLDLHRPARHRQARAAPHGRSARRPRPRAAGSSLGLEPSCTAVFRSDAPDLFPDDLDVARLRKPDRHAGRAAHRAHPRLDAAATCRACARSAQVHCHQHAVLGWDADQRAAPATPAPTPTGSTPAAAAWPATSASRRGHLDVSVACAESVLLPALRDADPDAVVLADGFSCRTQIHQLDSGGREAIHLAELLDRAPRAGPRDTVRRRSRPRRPADGPAARPRRPRSPRWAGAGAAGCGRAGRSFACRRR